MILTVNKDGYPVNKIVYPTWDDIELLEKNYNKKINHREKALINLNKK